MAEVDEECVKRCDVLIDTKEALDVGDLSCLKHEGDSIPSSFVGLIGDALVRNIVFGRRQNGASNNTDCTFYKSCGTAIQDLVSAHVAVEHATENNIGVNFEM